MNLNLLLVFVGVIGAGLAFGAENWLAGIWAAAYALSQIRHWHRDLRLVPR